MARLDGKVAIITGGTTGIGRGTVEAFAAEGATVIIAARREAEGQALAKALGPKVSFARLDATVEADWVRLIADTVQRHGRIDCLFNNAGVPGPQGSIEGIDMDHYERCFAGLCRSVVLGMKHVAPVMKRQRAGSIINNGSVAASRAGLSSSMIYSMAKAAVVHITKCVAMELGEHNVRVNSISPGGIVTGIFGKAFGIDPKAADRTAETVEKALATIQPIPRAGRPEDIAHAAVFLASDESTFINGHDLVVDGGAIGGRMWTAQQEGLKAMGAALRAAAGA